MKACEMGVLILAMDQPGAEELSLLYLMLVLKCGLYISCFETECIWSRHKVLSTCQESKKTLPCALLFEPEPPTEFDNLVLSRNGRNCFPVCYLFFGFQLFVDSSDIEALHLADYNRVTLRLEGVLVDMSSLR